MFLSGDRTSLSHIKERIRGSKSGIKLVKAKMFPHTTFALANFVVPAFSLNMVQVALRSTKL